MTKIFISYRRQDTKQIAGRIFDRLETKFGRDNVFMDIDSIPFGVDFHEFLSEQVGRAETVLALIGHGWADARDDAGNKRLENPDDFVRIEIEAALSRGIPLGAVLIDGAPMPRPEQLPESMRALTRRNAAFVDPGRDFNVHMNRLIDDLERHLTNGFGAVARGRTGSERYRAEGRIEVDAPLVTNDHGRWFLPGAGKTESFKDLPDGPEMVVVPPGKFVMGASPDEKGSDDDERPQHEVTIPKPFAVGRYPVTNAEWAVFSAKTGRAPADHPSEKDRHPVVNISWEDAKAYIDWLNGLLGGDRYRLLSESEWEYCCRAGTTTRYFFGDEITREDANFGRNPGGTSKVGDYPQNDFGLFDMHGNVWEWVEDHWHDSYEDKPEALKANGGAWMTKDKDSHVLRGGSWGFNPNRLRSAFRGWYSSDIRGNNFGFRVARTLTS